MGYRDSSNGTWNGRKCALGCDGPAFFWPWEGGLFGESVLHQPVVHLTLLRIPPTPHSDSVPCVDLPRGSRWAWQLRSPEWNTHLEHTSANPRSAASKCRNDAQVRRLLALAMVRGWPSTHRGGTAERYGVDTEQLGGGFSREASPLRQPSPMCRSCVTPIISRFTGRPKSGHDRG